MQTKIPEMNEQAEEGVLPDCVQLALGGKENIKQCKKHEETGFHVCVADSSLINEEQLHEAGVELLFKLSEELVYLSPFIPS